MPFAIRDLEITGPFEAIWTPPGYDGIAMLVRYLGCPLGWVFCDNPVFTSVEQIERAIMDQFGWTLWGLLATEELAPLPGPPPRPPISVIIPCRERVEALAGCLDALQHIDYPTVEIIVVDCASADARIAQLAAERQVRYVRQRRTGFDHARNLGLASATHQIVAFIDDDTRVDRLWLHAIADALADPEIMAVTGPIAPQAIDTRPQAAFVLAFGGMERQYERRTLRRHDLSLSSLLSLRPFGTSTNIAIRREVFDRIGSFNEELDQETPRGGGTTELLHRSIASGAPLLFEPRMLIWHAHRPDFGTLRHLMVSYGRDLATYLLTCTRDRHIGRLALLHYLLVDWLSARLLRRLFTRRSLPRHLIALELLGALTSPLAQRFGQRPARSAGAETPEWKGPRYG